VKHTKRCGTKRGEHMKHVVVTDGRGLRRVTMHWDTCATCGAWLPLGPSDETRVAVEVRAAELAVAWKPATVHEEIGWLLVTTAAQQVPANEGQLAGYLAHAISNHDDEQEEAAARAVAREVRDGIEPSGMRLKGQR
jgi:hypothetical protein